MMASNYLGPFLLTRLVLERVKAAAPARIVVVGSEALAIRRHVKPQQPALARRASRTGPHEPCVASVEARE